MDVERPIQTHSTYIWNIFTCSLLGEMFCLALQHHCMQKHRTAINNRKIKPTNQTTTTSGRDSFIKAWFVLRVFRNPLHAVRVLQLLKMSSKITDIWAFLSAYESRCHSWHGASFLLPLLNRWEAPQISFCEHFSLLAVGNHRGESSGSAAGVQISTQQDSYHKHEFRQGA